MDEALVQGLGLTFRLDQASKALIVDVQPDPRSAPIDEPWLLKQLDTLGYAHLRYLPEQAMRLLSAYNAGQRLASLALAECVDATLHVQLSPDEQQALLDITPAQGGERVSKKQVLDALEALAVVEGIKLDVIDQALAAGVASGVVIASGQAVVHGENGRLESLIPESRERVPRVSEDGQADFRDLGDIFVVKPGDRLMLRHPPTQGTPGVAVTGKVVAPVPGKPAMYANGLKGVVLDQDNPDLLIADIAGQPVQVNGGMVVEPVYTVAAVNMSTGNIDFDGSVKVCGDVSAGMRVRASGDIEIGGTAEPCCLEAGGDIVIKGGALGDVGRTDSAAHYIRCGGSFSVGFAQQVRVEAGDSIFVDDMTMRSELVAENNIVVGNKRRGHIIGGKALATLSISGKVLGSPNRITTVFEVGVSPELNKRSAEISRARSAKEAQLLEISKLLAFAGHHPDRIPKEALARARTTAAGLSDEIQALREESDELARRIAMAQSSRVVASQAMHDGVVVQMGGQRYKVQGEHGPCFVALGKHGLELTDGA